MKGQRPAELTWVVRPAATRPEHMQALAGTPGRGSRARLQNASQHTYGKGPNTPSTSPNSESRGRAAAHAEPGQRTPCGQPRSTRLRRGGPVPLLVTCTRDLR